MNETCRRIFRFEGFCLDPSRRLLFAPDGKRIMLKPKSLSTLICFVTHAGELLDKHTLMREIWGDRIVDDNNLNHHISTLRHVLGERPGDNRFIVTEPGHGYRFVANVSVAENASPETGKNVKRDEPKAGAVTSIRLSARPRLFAAGIALVATLASAAYWQNRQGVQADWMREALPAFEQLIESGDWEAAFALARQAEARIGAGAALDELWPRVSWQTDILSEPAGATVYRRGYDTRDSAWEPIGTTPLESVRIPFGLSRIRLEADGYLPLDRTLGGGLLRPRLESAGRASLDIVVGSEMYRLETSDTLPEGKVRVAAWSEAIGGERTEFADFFLDRTEVTNAQFKAFVDAGGYRRPELWEPVIRDGETIPWEEAMSLFVDRTGRPGPSTWEGGDFLPGQADFPVSGVSWYEAAAYASFTGQELPTAYHWRRARAGGAAPWVISASNLDGDGPMAVAESGAMSYVGAYDLAGNVREWTATRSRKEFVIAGGSWSDEPYVAAQPLIATALPLDRSAENGFRLVMTSDQPDARMRAATPFNQQLAPEHREPIDDETFDVYGLMFEYDRLPLNASIDEEETTRLWTRQRITFDAAYGDERVALYLYLPKTGTPPYQTVVYWPTSSAYLLRSVDDYQMYLDFIVRNGRAVAFPVYAGTFERRNQRGPPFAPTGPTGYRDNLVEGIMDIHRSLDYLETRSDIDSGAFAFFGHSQGGVNAPIALAQEPRLRAGIVYVGFLPRGGMDPVADPVHALPRVDVPVLLLSGEFDSTAPVEMARQYFDLIGTPSPRKQHVIAPGAHFVPRAVLVRESLDWLDRYLAPVSRPADTG